MDRDGQLWTTEHGMRGGDELNRVMDAGDYGWPLDNLGTLYSGEVATSPSGPGRHTTFTPPAFAWVPSIATSNVMQLQGFHETWDGDLLVGSLKARTIFRVRVQEGRVIYVEPIPIGSASATSSNGGPTASRCGWT